MGMKQQDSAVPAAACHGFPDIANAGRLGFRMGALATVQSQLTVQATGGAWNALMTTPRHGKFLLRRRVGSSIDDCPLRTYEIRHVEAGSPPGRNRAGPGWMESFGSIEG